MMPGITKITLFIPSIFDAEITQMGLCLNSLVKIK